MIKIVTYGSKYGHPQCNYKFDVSYLPNPNKMQANKDVLHTDSIKLTEEVMNHIRSHPTYKQLMLGLVTIVMAIKDSNPMTIAIGCTGGNHRSKTVAFDLALNLGKKGIKCSVEHTIQR